MKNHDSAFTLIELIVVIIVIGILVSVAFPNYQRAVERGVQAEAVQLLGTLRAAQLRQYDSGKDCVIGGTVGAADSLDIEVPTYDGLNYGTKNYSLHFWNGGPSGTINAPDGILVIAMRRNSSRWGTYALYILIDGSIGYLGGGAPAGPGPYEVYTAPK